MTSGRDRNGKEAVEFKRGRCRERSSALHIFYSNAGAALVLAMLLGVVCMQPATGAAVRDSAWNLHTLTAAFAKRHFARAKFHERKYLGVLNRPLDVTGTLTYRAPNMLEKRVESPVHEIYRVKGDRVSIRRKGKPSRSFAINDYPQLSALIESIRAVLKGDGMTLNRLYTVMLHGDRAGWTLELKPRLPPLQRYVRRIKISGRDNRIERIVTAETDGDSSIMDLAFGRASRAQ